jgi:lipopolysaccharide export system protein LptA
MTSTASSFRVRVKAALLLGMLVTLNPAHALKADRNAPMDVLAKQGKFSLGGGEQVLSGDVRITQGSLAIAADQGSVLYKDGQVGSATFEGKPARVSQDRDTGGKVMAQASKIVYDLTANTVTLVGSVKIEENGNTISGERFVYSLDTGAIDGQGGQSQVNMRIMPTPKKVEAP